MLRRDLTTDLDEVSFSRILARKPNLGVVFRPRRFALDRELEPFGPLLADGCSSLRECRRGSNGARPAGSQHESLGTLAEIEGLPALIEFFVNRVPSRPMVLGNGRQLRQERQEADAEK